MLINKGFIGFRLLIFFLIIIVGVISFYYINGKLNYNKDVSTLYSIANELGYSPKNNINFRRIYSWGSDSS